MAKLRPIQKKKKKKVAVGEEAPRFPASFFPLDFFKCQEKKKTGEIEYLLEHKEIFFVGVVQGDEEFFFPASSSIHF